jgi:asparagine synthase (glutamine-hydrolysing)
VRLAAKVAAALQLNWKTVRFSPPSGLDLQRLLGMKSGMNYLGMAFILPFFDVLEAEYGRDLAFFTGDGGDKILPDHRPRSDVQSLDALVRYVLAKHEVLPLPTVASLTGVHALDIVASLEERLRSYPEEQFEDKHVHFVLFERAFKWLFEGEDRNRQFFWSVSPFYGREPFRLAMECPPRLKARYALYRSFMESLSPELIDVESTTCGPSLRLERHPVFRLGRTLRRWSPVGLKRGWRQFTRPSVAAAVLDCIREQLAPSSPATKYVSPGHADAVLEELERTQAYMLLTLTSTIEHFTTGLSTLERYRDTYFT